MATDDPSDEFRVIASGAIRRRILDLQERASRTGGSRKFLQRLSKIQNALANDPIAFGEPLRDYPSLGLVVYRRIEGCIVVGYSVDEIRRLVYLKSFHPFPTDAY